MHFKSSMSVLTPACDHLRLRTRTSVSLSQRSVEESLSQLETVQPAKKSATMDEFQKRLIEMAKANEASNPPPPAAASSSSGAASDGNGGEQKMIPSRAEELELEDMCRGQGTKNATFVPSHEKNHTGHLPLSETFVIPFKIALGKLLV